MWSRIPSVDAAEAPLYIQSVKNVQQLEIDQRRAERVALKVLKLMFSGKPLPPGMMENIAMFVDDPVQHAHELEEVFTYWMARGLRVP